MEKLMTEYELTQLIRQLNADAVHEASMSGMMGSCTADQREASMDGWIRVKDNAIIVQDPIGNGKPPVIRCSSPVRLIINCTCTFPNK
jgi:hypothetical protein